MHSRVSKSRRTLKVLEFAKDYDGFTLTTDVMEAAKDSDVVFTDTWASMGQEEEKAVRMKVFKGYQVNDELMAAAHSKAMIQHCLPAYRGQEISDKIFEEHADEIFDEAENRLHVQKAVMIKLMSDKEI